MDAILLSADRKLVPCPHCGGTSMCAHSLLAAGVGKRLVPRCSRCGDGLARHSAFMGELKEWRAPICAVCDGKGYLTL